MIGEPQVAAQPEDDWWLHDRTTSETASRFNAPQQKQTKTPASFLAGVSGLDSWLAYSAVTPAAILADRRSDASPFQIA